MKDNIKFILGFLGLATVYVGLVSYGTITSYYTGYLWQFGADIKDVNFWPRPYDFMVQALYVVLALVVITLLIIALLLAMNGIVKLVAKRVEGGKRFYWLKSWLEAAVMSKLYLFGIVVVCLVMLSFKVALGDAHKKGVNDAQKQDTFTVVQTERAGTSVIIYQSGNLAIIKDYDEKTGTFSDTYRAVDLIDRDQRIEKIK